jgi:hypothetical protein
MGSQPGIVKQQLRRRHSQIRWPDADFDSVPEDRVVVDLPDDLWWTCRQVCGGSAEHASPGLHDAPDSGDQADDVGHADPE